MLKLKALQAAQSQQTSAAAAASSSSSTAGGAASNGTSHASGSDSPTQSRGPVKDPAAEAAKSGTTNVLSLRKADPKGGKNAKKNARQNAAELRAQKDLSEMPSTPGIEIQFPNPENIMNFHAIITPKDGLYLGARFVFDITVPPTYPYDPPKVHCDTLVYHPNIDWEGHVCLNILRQDWMPVLNLGSVVFGLMTLFLEPNPDDPLNKDAAKTMIDKPREFERNVKSTLRGGYMMGRTFPALIK